MLHRLPTSIYSINLVQSLAIDDKHSVNTKTTGFVTAIMLSIRTRRMRLRITKWPSVRSSSTADTKSIWMWLSIRREFEMHLCTCFAMQYLPTPGNPLMIRSDGATWFAHMLSVYFYFPCSDQISVNKFLMSGFSLYRCMVFWTLKAEKLLAIAQKEGCLLWDILY